MSITIEPRITPLSPIEFIPATAPIAPEVLNLAAEAAVAAKQAKQTAAERFADAESILINSLLAAGVTSLTLADGTKVTLKGGLDGEETRSIDVGLLAERIPAATLAKVTKPVIDLKAFDAAVTNGLITPEVANEVTGTAPKKRSLTITVPVAARA